MRAFHSVHSPEKNAVFLLDAHEVGADLPELLAPRLIHGLVRNDVLPGRRLRVLSVPPPVHPRRRKLVRRNHICHTPARLLFARCWRFCGRGEGNIQYYLF